MIARINSVGVDGSRVRCTVQYLDGSPLAEVGVHEFVWESTAINQQVKADIIAWGKSLAEVKADTDRLLANLAAGTEFTV